jgi:vacuolar protein sorting-associated protein 45
MKSSSANKMDATAAVRFYVDKIVSDPSISGMLLILRLHICSCKFLLGMKALILDPLTTQVISMVYSQTQILEKEVYLVELLGKRHEAMTHLKAAVYLSPTESNIEMLCREIREPQFSEYHIFFSNIVSQDILNRLGRADEHEVVRQVQEYYAEFLTINDDFFHLGIDDSLVLSSPIGRGAEAARIFSRNVEGVLSVLLALRRRPSQIRYSAASDLARRISQEIVTQIEKDDVFDFRRSEAPMLLILDRRDDPVTPLLTQWTYQAMVHELLGLNNNRVLLRGAPGIRKDLEEVVISATQDAFFAKHRFANFGDLGTAVKEMLDEYQRNAKMNESIASIEDMQAFMERYPAFRSHSINVSKHVALMSELARLVDLCHLLDISALEQEIACSSDHTSHRGELFEKIASPAVQKADKLRLALLYVIKYEQYDELANIKAALMENGVERVNLLDAMLQYAGEARRAPGLFSQGGLLGKIGKSIASTVNGVENVYTQHVPLLQSILESIGKGKLKDSAFPLITAASGQGGKVNEVVVFIVGGATYEEALAVAEYNNANPSMRIILGGSCVQNSQSFLDELKVSFSL